MFVWARTRHEANRRLLCGINRTARWEILMTLADLKGCRAPVVLAVEGFDRHPEFTEIFREILRQGGLVVKPHLMLQERPELAANLDKY